MSPSAAQTGVGEGNKISANKNNLTFNDFEALLNYIWVNESQFHLIRVSQ